LIAVGCAGNQAVYDIPAVYRNFGNTGNTIALRDALIRNPDPPGVYPAGSTVPVLDAIVNQGNQTGKLITVASPAASQAQMVGTADIPPRGTVISTASSSPIDTPPTSPLVTGRLRITLTLTAMG
jgi:hypothetical protein